jgi:hypothetical protein
VVKLKSSLRKFYGRSHDLEYASQSVYRDHNVVLSSFMAYHRVCTSTSTRVTRRVTLVEQELLTLPEHLEFTFGF